ncbi:MAG TPA: FtsX-like permease family protein [Trebonia sp.]|nr:FtsX-like permease family protein [Trebonia sp.]
MNAPVIERPPAARRPEGGGLPARRAVIRWAIRLLRREWRQQALILALIAAAVAATVIASAVAVATQPTTTAQFGTAQDAATVSGPSAQVTARVAALRRQFGRVDVIETRTLPFPGSVQDYSLKAQDPHGPYGGPLLALASGRYPAGAGQVAVTSGVASALRLAVGGTATIGGITRTVTGIVTNPQDLLDQFALVAPGQLPDPDQATVLFSAPGTDPGKLGPGVTSVGQAASGNVINPQTISLTAATLGMLLIALVGVGGFTVMAQRRLRAFGLLAAQGATTQDLRLVVQANGVATGVLGAGLGLLTGLAGWLAYRPTAQASAHHVIGPWQLPWTVIVVAVVLAIAASYFAASRPARAIARIPVVAALAGRPPAPRATGRVAGAVGTAFLVAAFLLLGVAGASTGGDGKAVGALVLGFVALAVAIAALAGPALSLIARLGGRAPVAVRLALRDLARYRARSGPALAAIALSTLIAAVVCVASAARFGNVLDYAGPNLTASQVVVYTAAGPYGGITRATPPPAQGGQGKAGPPSSAASDAAADAKAATAARAIATSLGAGAPVALYSAAAGLTHAGPGRNWSGPVYVATPQLLAAFGIAASAVRPDADILSMRPGLPSVSQLELYYGAGAGSGDGGDGGQGAFPCPAVSCLAAPVVQAAGQLPSGTSAPNTVLTEHAVSALHLGPTLTLSGWLVQAPRAVTAAQATSARGTAAGAGATIETRNSIPSLSVIVNDATTFGIALALAILAMSVGLVRSESGRDLRTLAATGAGGATRRTLTAATAFTLAFSGAVMGVAGGYLAAIGFFRTSQLDGLAALGSIPVANLLLILLGTPLLAAAAGWLLSGREPSMITRQPPD